MRTKSDITQYKQNRTKANVFEAYKPNGITDGRSIWFGQMWSISLTKWYNYENKILEEQRIADSHDITKSTFGYE